MSEANQEKILHVANIEEGSRFFIICLTCSILLLQFKKDPQSNLVSNRVLRDRVSDHLEGFEEIHDVILFDFKTKVTSAALAENKRIN